MAEQIAPGRAEQPRGNAGGPQAARIGSRLDYGRFSTWLVHAFDEIGVETMRSKRLTVRGVLTDLSLAALSSVVTVLGTVAFSAMIFSGHLVKVVPLAFVAFLAGTALSGLIIGLFSRFYCNLSGAQDESAAILAAFASGLAGMGVIDEGAAISTMFIVIVLSTASFGLVLLLLGILKWGKYTQLIPYPVVGGFLAGVGMLMLSATIKFLSGVTVTMDSLPQFLSWEMTLRWLPSLIAASLLYWGMNRIRSVLLLPIGLVCVLVLFYTVAGALSFSLASLQERGFVFTSIPEGDGVFDGIKWLSITRIDWSVVLEARDEIGALILVCTIGASLATTALEIGAEIELESNHELQAHGLANLVSALVGGIPAFTLAGPSLTYLRLGASSRLMPILRALFTVALGVAGLSLLGFVPKIVVGTLLILFSFGLVDEWLIQARHRLSLTDYVFVLIIAGIIELAGFLPGVGAGILIAAADFLIQYSKLNVIKAELSGRDYRSDVERPLSAENILREAGGRVITFEIQGFIFFGTAIRLLERIRASVEASTQKIDYVILGFANVDGLDAAAHFALRKLHNFAKAENICLLLSGLTRENAKALQAANVLDNNQSLHFANTAMAFEYVENHLLKPFDSGNEAISAENALVAILGDQGKAIVLLSYFTFHDVRAGGQVFHEGDDADSSILLVRGNLSAHLDLGGGQSVRLRKFLPGTLVGEMAFYTGRKRSASLVADTDATIGVISGESILRLNRDQPAVAAEFHQMTARLMANRIIAMNATLRTLLTGLTIPKMLGRTGEAIE
jgi:sulfate permease, SulP family